MTIRVSFNQSHRQYCQGCARMIDFDTSDIRAHHEPITHGRSTGLSGSVSYGSRLVHTVECVCGSTIEVKS